MTQLQKDTLFLERCFQLARNGLGTTYPNPLVGCVIVANNTIIGEGFHYIAGKEHAEVLAIQNVTNPELLPNATLYVNLEPCNHYGKTPPCSHLIVEKGIKRVVIAGKDYHDIVNGEGIKHLQTHGVEVQIIEDLTTKNKYLNRRFFTYHQQKRPYIILKWAQSRDGFIDDSSAQPKSISNTYSKQLNHKWRAEEQAILVGKNTMLKDNPCLNARTWKGKENYKIFIDKELEVPATHNIFLQKKVIVFNAKKEEVKGEITYKQLNFTKKLLPQITRYLYDQEIQSIIIEGGTQTLESFITYNLWDEARVITSDVLLESGVKAPNFKHTPANSYTLKNDVVSYYYNV